MSDAGSSTDGLAAGTVAAESPATPREGAAENPASAAAAAAEPAERAAGEGDGRDFTEDGEPLLKKIERLKTEQTAMRKRRKELTKDLKNAEKRRTRLRKRARQLSDADLREVLEMRRPEQEHLAAAAGAAAEPASSSTSARPAGEGASS